MRAFIVGAARTLIAPKHGMHRHLQPHELAAPVMQALLDQAGFQPRDLQGVLLGNALAAGGNPARVATLAAFSTDLPAITIDTQCCSGLDAIGMAAAQICAGQAQALIAGGVESFSQAPLRARRTDSLKPAFYFEGQGYQPYTQAQFAPNKSNDPHVLFAAQAFADRRRITRAQQEAYAIESHRRALASLTNDPFTRPLTQKICDRMAGRGAYAVTNATVAVEADAAAVLLVVNESIAQHYPSAVEITHYVTAGVRPDQPAEGGIAAGRKILRQLSALKSARNLERESSRQSARQQPRIVCAEIMESFAAQAIATISDLKLNPEMVNPAGGMLARGHPIGASGAVLVGNLFLALQAFDRHDGPRGARGARGYSGSHGPRGARDGRGSNGSLGYRGSLGLAVIPAAGGLGSAMLLRR
jgi:acetyl-CoA C-acetyltransferase